MENCAVVMIRKRITSISAAADHLLASAFAESIRQRLQHGDVYFSASYVKIPFSCESSFTSLNLFVAGLDRSRLLSDLIKQ